MSKGETTGDKFKIVTFQVIGTLLWLPEQAIICSGANICLITSSKLGVY